MAKRTQRTAAGKPVPKQETKPVWPNERHSGEGAASALAILQKIEKRRGASKPNDPQEDR